MTRWLAVAVLLTVLFHVRDLAAQDVDATTKRCIADFDDAQRHRDDGELITARSKLEGCAAKTCPAAVVERCVRWLEEVDAEMPTVILSARTASGAVVDGVRVLEGEATVAASLDGRAVALDPGRHVLVFHHPDGGERKLDVMIRAGEKNRLLEVRFENPSDSSDSSDSSVASPAPPAPAVPTPAPNPSPMPPPHGDEGTDLMPFAWIGFGVAGAGVVLGGIMLGVAADRLDEIEAQCEVACTEDEIDSGRKFAHVATASFIIAGAGAALGTILVVATLVGGDDETSVQAGVSISGLTLRGRF